MQNMMKGLLFANRICKGLLRANNHVTTVSFSHP